MLGSALPAAASLAVSAALSAGGAGVVVKACWAVAGSRVCVGTSCGAGAELAGPTSWARMPPAMLVSVTGGAWSYPGRDALIAASRAASDVVTITGLGMDEVTLGSVAENVVGLGAASAANVGRGTACT